MSMINMEVSDFRTYAFHESEFTFACPTELENLTDKYEQFRAIGCEV